MNVNEYLEDAARSFQKYKLLAEKAIDQISTTDFFATLGAEENSVAIIMKHMAGNMKSRWTDFLTTDGEKPDRERDSEFEITAADSRERLLDRWEKGWRLLWKTLEGLGAEDIGRTVTIRGEPHTVLEAIQRQLSHYAYHAGQIVFLARHHAGERWRSLSIPRGQSRDIEVSKGGEPYGTGT
ncbi:MAG: DUF1572 family protein [Planctomycetota bacterium]|nr:DUF1572 family protein [Planctomycetota bacterium]